MSKAEDMTSGAEEGGQAAPEAADARDLNVLLAHIADQIALTTRRETEALHSMRARAAGLADETLAAMSEATPEQSRTLERIEDRIASLADQMAATQPQPAFTTEEAWDRDVAEELTRVYEDSAASIERRHEPIAVGASSSRERAHVASAAYDPLPRYANSDWLESRFGVIAERLEHTLTEFRPESSLVALGPRFDRLEQHVDSVLQTISSRPDEGTLNLIEAQIIEICASVRDAQQQLGQLDQIENQLKSVATSLSDERMSKLLDQRGAAGADLEQYVQQAAQQAAERLAAEVRNRQPGDDATAVQFSELRALFEGYINERRANDDMTASALDTLQQAMISLLDRVEGMEQRVSAAGKPVPADFGYGSEPPPLVSDEQLSDAYRTASEEFDTGARDNAARLEANNQPLPGYPSAMSPPMSYAQLDDDLPDLRKIAAEIIPGHNAEVARADLAPANAIDRIRQELVADAQRAKLKAAGDSLMAAPAIFRTDRPSKAAAAKGGKPSVLSSGASTLSGIPTKRLLVGALALLVAINGALLLIPRKSSAPTADTPSATMKTTDPATTGTTPPAGLGRAPAPDADIDNIIQPTPAPERGSDNGRPRPFEPKYSDAARANYDVETSSVGDASEGYDARRLPGVMLQESDTPLDGEALERLQRRENMAHASTRLGATVARSPSTTAAYFPQNTPPTAGRAPVTDGATDTGPRGNAELPPADVGPLSLRIAAANGDPSAQFEVAARLAEGKGIEQNLAEAVRWYQKSATRGFAQSQYRLATLYERGLGVKADPQRARVWYQRAAEQGSVKAMHNLAVLLASRDVGAPDYAGAVTWFGEAAQHGLADSQFNLAVLAEAGLGTPKDLKAAYKWFALAGGAGDAEAQRRRNLVKSQLGASTVAEIDAQVRSFQPKAMNRLSNDARAAGEDWKSRQNADNNG